MASLNFAFPFDSYEAKKLNFCINGSHVAYRSCFFSCSSYFVHSKVSEFSDAPSFNNRKQLKVSCFDSELRDASLKDHGSIESLPDTIDEKLIADKMKISALHKTDSVSKRARVSNARNGNAQRVVSVVNHDQLHDDLGVDPSSTIGQCNMVLKRLEKSSDFKALELFAWMKRNGKLRGNVTAYNLALRVLSRKGDWDGAESLIQEMKLESGCKLGYQVFNTIIYACSKRGLVEVGARWFRLMMKYGIEPNVATFGMLMSLYQKDWNVKEAEFAFSLMRKLRIQCQSAYSSMITIYTRLGLYAKAEEVIALLTEDEVDLNVENWLVMLNAYSQQGKLQKAESVLLDMKKKGFAANIVAYNTLMTGYGKISNMDSAERVFQSLESNALLPDETSFRSMIEGWARVGNYEKAKWYYQELKASGFKPNSSNLYSLLKLQANNVDVEGTVETLSDILKIGCQPSSVLGTLIQAYEQAGQFDKVPLVIRSTLYEHVLVNQTACSILVMAYIKYNLVDNATRVLKEKLWNDPIFEDNLYHLLICSCKELGRHESAVEIYTQMPKSDETPNLHIVSTMIDIYSTMNQFDDAESLYQILKSSEVKLDLVAFTVVVRMYVKAGSLSDACAVLDIMQKQNVVPDVYLVRDMLRIYQQCEAFEKLSDLYYGILKSQIPWDEEMYNCVINCCARALPVDELSRLFDEMLQKGFSPSTITCNVMLHVYGKARIFRKARKVFWAAKKRGLTDVISYNTLIAAYGQSRNLRRMKSTVEQMQFHGFSVSLEAYNCMLDSYGKQRQMENFKDVLRKMKDSNSQSDNYTYNILINIYGERGWIEEVKTVLEELKENGSGPDLCGYNTLIKAYGIAGMVEEAVSLIKEMRENGINPDRTTYLNLIKILQRNDQFLEAVKWSLWMKQTGFS